MWCDVGITIHWRRYSVREYTIRYDVVPIPDDEFQALIKSLYNGDTACIQKLINIPHISSNGKIYSQSWYSLNLLNEATTTQQIDEC